MLYRADPGVRVVAFTAQQIPHIDDRRYPPQLAGDQYPEGIPIHTDEKLADLIKDNAIDLVWITLK